MRRKLAVIRKYSPGMLLCLLVLTATAATQGQTARSTRTSVAPPDKAYLQKIWDGWETLDASHQTQFYAQGPHVFFDEAPLKYDSWHQYHAGVSKILATIKSAKFTVNTDAQIHPAGHYFWATATVDQDALLKDGKRDVATFRWTVIFARENGKWLIVHEHISRPTE